MVPKWAAQGSAGMRGPILAACLLLALSGCAQSPAALPAAADPPQATQPLASAPTSQAPVTPPSPVPSSPPTTAPSPPPSTSTSPPAPPSTTSRPPPPTEGPKPPPQPITFILKATTPAACADLDEVPALTQGNATLYTEHAVPAGAWNRSYQSSGANPVNGKVCAYWLDDGRKVLAMGDAGKVPAGASRLFAVIQGGSGEYKLNIT